MKIEMKPLDSLSKYDTNPKAHPPEQVAKIADSIAEFGFLVPLVIDSQGVIVAGHGRYLAAELMGLPEVPTIDAGNLSADQLRAFRIADNKVAESDWLEDALQEELHALHAAGYDINLTGFSLEDITGADDELERRIMAEPEHTAHDENGVVDFTRQIQDRISEIAAADPHRFEKAQAIVLPLRKGSRDCFLLVDQNCSDAIRELKRY
ncbi:MAG: ParB/Srx family N-terminal domain-containing protein, partial [Deltaproteobacteria bacterium]